MVKVGDRVRIKCYGHRNHGKIGVVTHVSASQGVGCPVCVEVPGTGRLTDRMGWYALFEVQSLDLVPETGKEVR